MKLDARLFRHSFGGSGPTSRGARRDLFLTVGLGLAGGVLLILQARFLSRTVSDVFLHGAVLDAVLPFLLALLTLALARAGVTWAMQTTAGRLAARVKAELRERLSAHLLALGPAFAWGERSGELCNTATEGIEALDAYLSQYLPQLALAGLIPLAILAFVLPLDPLSGVVLLVTAPLIPFFMNLIGSVADSLTQRQWASLSRMSAHFLDVLQGLTTLRLLGRARDQIDVIRQVSDHFRQATMSVLRVAFLSALVLEMLATISTAVVAVQIGLRLLHGHLHFEQAFFVLLLAPEFYLPLRMLGTRFHAGMAGVAAARRIFEILDTPVPPQRAPTLDGETRPAQEPAVGLIRLDGVCLTYDDERGPALQDLSLDIRGGERLALVGPSGSGKSTIAHLLLRFVEPDAGDITVGGVSLYEIPAAAWRQQVAWVPQIPYLFFGTVLENLRLARPGATMDEIVAAAQLAHAHDFITALPQGYQTLIGERAVRLSGGQAQRLAVARAFLAVQGPGGAQLLVLDEATANLDPEHDRLIQESVAQLLPGRTALIIAHRLTTLAHADRIGLVESGQLVDAGTHQELLERSELYRRLLADYLQDDGRVGTR
jgi:ATP-binding cassette subfamily C protein CydD